MPPDAVILYGPPAAGKDTITAALTSRDDRFVHFDRLKVGAGAPSRYRYATADDLTRLQDRGQILYVNERYGNIYAIDRPRLDEITGTGRIPVVHLGQVAGIAALRAEYPARWLTVLLWCPRDITADRLRQRGSTDIPDRLRAWDETRADLTGMSPAEFGMVLRTDQRTPEAIAEQIRRQVAGTTQDAAPIRDELD
ncbi:guanylate kinase [Frankia sp. KB5]|uniref:guanylate kinase n=1 Tax=Frankia sp. KB5 TaxID=683318 RepID=UPI000A0F4902|nr:guanylate kinase [Frankia sp. KB5]ORT51526.1 guanylate kinase [Frankia sp. KB5]